MRWNRLLLGLIAFWLTTYPAAADGRLDWREWSEKSFADAKAQNRLILLDLEAVWCHWCHVMEETTYRDSGVVQLLNDHFILIKADQDAHPDLSTRYGDWGWPATILYAPDGTEIAKIRGYRDPDQMTAILNAFIKEPTPGPSVEPSAAVTPAQSKFLTDSARQRLIGNYLAVYDRKNGGWGDAQKFIHTDSMDYALALAANGDAEATAMARLTLDRATALIDPVWGGLYQYSDKADWSSPHYEKIMWYQAQGLRQYSLAYSIFGSETYRKAAADIARYLTGPMMAKEGAFYTSQDADVSQTMPGKVFYGLAHEDRLAAGFPRIDVNIYARENGWAIAGLAAYSDATGDEAALEAAIRAAEYIIKERSLPNGGFAHGENDRAGPYLGDSLAMGQGLLALYASTGSRKWLLKAIETGDFIAANFRAEIGFITAVQGELSSGPLSTPVASVEENIQAVQFFNLLHRYSGTERAGALAAHGMRYLASDGVTNSRRFLAGILNAEDQLAVEPVHITVIGQLDDTRARQLHQAARALKATYKRIDWWDMREGAMINPDVQYPEMDEAAAFACSNNLCSRPAFTAEELDKAVASMSALRIVRRE